MVTGVPGEGGEEGKPGNFPSPLSIKEKRIVTERRKYNKY
jgi:hypothetical protein